MIANKINRINSQFFYFIKETIAKLFKAKIIYV